MKNIPLVVGNKVTYIVNGVEKTILITDSDDIEMLKDLEIKKVYACDWEEIEFEEEKELFTEEEKEFLKSIIKWYDNIVFIKFKDTTLDLSDDKKYCIGSIDYPKNIKFQNVQKHVKYTLKELGLDE